MPQIVLIPSDVAAPGKEYLLSHGYALRVLQDASVENICRNIGGCAAVLGRLGRYPRAVFAAGRQLQIFAKHGAGVDDVDLAAAREFGVTVTNTPEANSNSVAEHTIGLLLACAQDIVRQDKLTRAGGFSQVRTEPTLELAGKTLGLVGFGRIARAVAQKAALGLGMRVLVWNHRPLAEWPPYVQPVPELSALLAAADAVSLHIPCTPDTVHLIDAEALAAMKPGAILLNLARGGIVDESALYRALCSGHLRMAGLDCHEHEPCTAQDPLFALDNVIVLPHAGGQSREAADAMSLHAALCIDDVLCGRPPRWPVYVPPHRQ